MPTLADVRSSTDEVAECVFMLFIEGIGYTWVSDHSSGVLLGSGAGSWIGQYEADASYTAHETLGQRTVVAGLQLPGAIPRGDINPNTGMLETTSVTFDLVDHDGVLAALFANEAKTYELLGQRVAPGTAALGASIITQEGTVDPAGMYLGIERIGPARERAWFYPFPWQGIGYHHQRNVGGNPDDPEGPPQTQVSSSPIVFAGRKVSLWRIYRNADIGDYTDWPHWGDQHEDASLSAGQSGLEWWGVMQDRGEFQGDGVWRIQCWGPESVLRRKLGTNDVGWMPIANASTEPPSERRQVAVAFKRTAKLATNSQVYDSAFFADITSTSATAYDSANELAAAINTFIQSYADGTNSDFGGATDFNAAGAYVSFSREEVRVRADDDAVAGTRYHADICAHEETWKILGWDLGAQGTHQSEVQNGTTLVVARKINEGDIFTPTGGAVGQGVQAPSSGYWTLTFHTVKIGHAPFADETVGDDDLINSQGWRLFHPKFYNDPVVLSAAAGQEFQVSYSYPYVEPDPMVIDDAYDAARYFLFRGKRTTLVGGEEETEDEYQIGLVQWSYQASNYGTVAEHATLAAPNFYLKQWAMPRAFNVDRNKFGGEWASVAGTDYEIQCRPLHCYSYRTVASDGVPFERSWAVLGQMMLSTGTGTGWDDITTLQGENTNPLATGDLLWIADVVGSEMGLGVPYQLVQDPQDLYDAFDLGVGGDQHSGMNEVRYTYSEPFDSLRLLESVIRPRGLAMTLRGGKYSVQSLRLFDPSEADFTINETEIHGEIGDPRTVVPSQELRATGPIDEIRLDAGHNPAENAFNVEIVNPARDIGARHRRGDIIEAMSADGLIPERFRYQAGQGSMIGSPWEYAFRQLWSFEIAKWRASRHFVVHTRLHRVAGQDVWPGAKVRFSNRWVFNPSGGLGVTGAVGIVIDSVLRVSTDPESPMDHYEVKILVFADQFDGFRLFSPVAKIEDGYTGGTSVTLVEDAGFMAHGDDEDGSAFSEPSWSNVGGNATVCVLEYDRGTWTLHSGDTQTVTSASGTSVTLSGSFSTTFHAYTDKYLVMAPYDSQAASNWVRSLMLPVVLETHVFGGSSTDGWPLTNG